MNFAQPRRVLYILQNLPVPFDRRAWLQATALAANGYTVTMICPKGRGQNASRETIEGIEINRYWCPVEGHGKLGFVVEFAWCFIATFLLSLRIALFGRGFDIFHVCNPPETYWPMAWFWRAFGKVFIWDYRDLSPELAVAKFGRSDGAMIKALLWLEKMTFAAAQLIVATNESYKKIAMERGKKLAKDIFIVRSAPSLARFKVYDRDPKYYEGKKHLFAYLGEICAQDGVENVVRAAKIMRDELGRDDFHCILIGGGPHQPAVVEYAREQGVADICTFTGIVSDEELCRILSSAEIGIDPVPKNDWSDRSTMNKILEYMFFGLPVVAFDLTEAKVSADAAGSFVEPGNDRAMAETISGLFDDTGRRRAMSEFGQHRLRTALAFEYSAPHLFACYEAAWAVHHAPPVALGSATHVDQAS